MPDEVIVDQALGIIKVRSFGVVTRDDIAGSIEQILQIQEETGFDRLLVDTTEQQVMPDPVDIFELFSTYPGKIKTALLLDRSQATAKDIEFVETVALNRGKAVKIHLDLEQALLWLKAG